MYSISDYGSMISSKARTDAYREALRRTVKPDSIVLDIGAGAGIFSLLACKFGARRVYAIEPADAIEVAREMAVANGCADRIEFIQDISTRVNLPERADIIVSDLRGVLPPFQHHLPSIIDARDRLLAPGGILIPRRDSLWAAVAQDAELYNDYASAWEDETDGLNLLAGRRFAINCWRKARIKPEQLLSDPQRWATLDYAALDNRNIGGEVMMTARREGTAHGLSVWFDSELIEGVRFSNRPGAQELIYGSAFFPLAEPIAIAPGDIIRASLRADLAGDDYIWRWNLLVTDVDSPGKVKADFKQSTFHGSPLSPAQLGKRAASYKPDLNEEGRIDRFILSQMDGRTSLEEIARRALNEFPSHFAEWQEALTRAGELSLKRSR
jgi:SAM-dependent methyltransferase